MIRLSRLVLPVSLMLAATALSGAAAAQAPDRAKGLELSAFLGASTYIRGGENHESDELRFQGSTPYGGRVAYNFTDHHGVEFSVANPLSFYGNYVYSFSPIFRRWVPYVTAGAGGSRYSNEYNEFPGAPGFTGNRHDGGPDSHTASFTGNFGGGVKFWLTPRWALRFDARDIVGRHDASAAGFGRVFSDRRVLHEVQFTGGVVFRFGGR